MKFVHAADIHLDSPLKGLSAYPDAPVAQLRGATRDALTALVDRAIEEAVDFMIIAGDLYDGSWRDYNTGIFFCKEMGRLKRAGIPVYVLFGNHDAESEMTRKLDLPDNVSCFSASKPQTFCIDGLSVALHGQSFKQKETTTNLAERYPAALSNYYNIGVLHTALEGSAAHATYAPCTVDELHAKGYQYWALGHVHEFFQWTGPSTIVFPGNLQGRHVRECGRRGAVLVTVDDRGHSQVERLFIDILRWEHVRVDASACTSLIEVSRCIGQALAALLDEGPTARAVRVTVHGRTRAHGQLFGLEAQLRSEVLAQIAGIGHERLWLEKVQLDTEAFMDAQQSHERLDAFAELQDILATAAVDPEFVEHLRQKLAAFAAKAPLDLHPMVPLIDDIRNGQLHALIKRVSPGLLAHLQQQE
ncbi:metallophosphoesterase family protein [Sphaerotilus uruguayifluvii]|uniref:DNA repair exonuclease SbcCD nuclease subunit n=1 Tax=Sphaerotilus uruguayifluvii TaxID=2735897 RepID=A0ABX2G6T1_9BURK|nr:DNA repair exonuclease [Leptothrix sp. C29]NRT58033.1 DNA repair exonuclease SbcCD nuclease subunit [Leptothrix sp. C29]